MATKLTSSANPRIRSVTRLRRSSRRRRDGLFVAEGHREVSRAIEAGLVLREVYEAPELLKQPLDPPADCPRFEVPAKLFVQMTYRDDPDGVLAVVEEPEFTLEKLPPVDGDTLYLVAVGTQKPGNLGAMVRTAAAAGCTAVLNVEEPETGGVDLFNPNAIRASTGAVFTLPTLSLDEKPVLDHLAAAAVNTIAATPDGSVPHTRADYRGPAAIVIGPEDRGLGDAWRRAAGQLVVIPMRGRTVDSLNASNAAAVLLYEATRHRDNSPG